jgi:hypothetical protein
MKVSKARKREATRIRDIALGIVHSRGMDGILSTVRGTHRHAIRRADLDGLHISHGCHQSGERCLDIWDGPKVFSVRWDISGALTVVSFHPGPWQDKLSAFRAEKAVRK